MLADYVLALLSHDGDGDTIRKLCEAEIPDFLKEGELACYGAPLPQPHHHSTSPPSPLAARLFLPVGPLTLDAI